MTDHGRRNISYLTSSFVSVPDKLKKSTGNPFVSNSIRVLHETHRCLKVSLNLSQFTPFWGNNNFPPGAKDKGFKLWADKGIGQIADLSQEDGSHVI